MTLRRRKSSSQNSFIQNKVFQFFFNPTTLPFTLLFSTLLILFVTFRMKSVEQTYQMNHLVKQVENSHIQNKELKAQRAKLLSAQNLKFFAEQFELKEPTADQIILIQ